MNIKQKKIAKKILKIIAIVIISVLLTSVYFKCGKDSERILYKDTLDVKIKEYNVIISELKKENDSLRKLKSIDSVKINNLNFNIIKLKNQSILVSNFIKYLPFDESCRYLQNKLTDTTTIQNIQIGNKIRACITSNQLTEVNISLSEMDYYKSINDSLNKFITISNNTNEINNNIISNLYNIINSKDSINILLEKRNDILLSENKEITKKYKHQKFWKYVFKGGLLGSLVLLSVK